MSVTASGGAGKSVLMQVWAQAQPDRRRLVSIRDVHEGIDALRALQTREPGATTVLDGVELVRTHDQRARLADLLREATGPIVLSGRTQPLTGDELDGARPVVTLGMSDLAFGVREAAALLRSAGVMLDTAALIDLVDRAEGHAATLSLAAATLARGGDPSSMVRELVHSPVGLPEALTEKLLSTLPAAEQDAILALAAVDSFGLELGAEMAGEPGIGGIIERARFGQGLLHRAERPGAGPVFRFETTLRTGLLDLLRARDARRLTALRVRASRWLLASGDTVKGLAVAVESGDARHVDAVLARHGLGLVFGGSVRAVRDALSKLETLGVLTPTSGLLSALITAPHVLGSVRIDHFLALAAADDVEGPRAVEHELVLRALRAARARSATETVNALRALDEALERSTRRPTGAIGAATMLDARLFVEATRAQVEFRDGALKSALRRAMVVAESATETRRLGITLLALDTAAESAAALGRWVLAHLFHTRAATLETVDGEPSDVVAAGVRLRAAVRAYESCTPFRMSELDDIVETGWPALDTFGTLPPRALRLLFRLDTEDDPRVAFEDLERLFDLSLRRNPAITAGIACRFMDLTLRYRGRTEARDFVSVLVRVLGPSSLEVAIAHVMLREGGRSAEADEGALEAALRSGARAWRAGNVVFAWLLLSERAEATGRTEVATARLATAVDLAASTEARRPFLARVRFVQMVEERLGRFGVHNDFAASVVAAANRSRRPAVAEPAHPIRLTARERSLLRELPLHQSIPDIAAKLHISPNTVKTHLRAIYAGCGSAGRAAAVDRAKSLGLL